MKRYKSGHKNRYYMTYSDRTREWLFPLGARCRKTVCPKCAKVIRSYTHLCPKCKNKLITISYRAKLPKKNSSFKKWKEFWKKHNDWCDKRPYFKNQKIILNIDHRI